MYLFLPYYHLPETKAFIYIGYRYENMVYTFDFYLNVNVDSYGLRIRLRSFPGMTIHRIIYMITPAKAVKNVG